MQDVLEQEITGKPVTVALAGQEYQLAYPVRAVILYKQKTGDNLFQSDCWQKVAPAEDPERFLACLWAGLQSKHPDITIEQLGELVDFGNATEMTRAIAEALTSYFPKKKEANPNVQTPENLPAAS